MESAKEVNIIENQDVRFDMLNRWLRDECRMPSLSIIPIAGDASFRRYFRVTTASVTYIAMDAPPPRENCQPFVAVAKALKAIGVLTPDIIAEDIPRGFLLLSDFGNYSLLKSLNVNNADQLYRETLDTLATLQSCRDVAEWPLPTFGETWLRNEWAWHKEWFLDKWLGLQYGDRLLALNACYERIIESVLSQPLVCMHRDFHSANLMVIDGDIGVLDFQDAFMGPLTYDIASLLRDCYIDWPNEKVMEWSQYYFDLLVMHGVLVVSDVNQYQRWFDFMGMQRHLKALLTFSRKKVRDHQPEYLQHVPRTLTYLINVSAAYPEMLALHQFLTEVVKPEVNKVLHTCEQ